MSYRRRQRRARRKHFARARLAAAALLLGLLVGVPLLAQLWQRVAASLPSLDDEPVYTAPNDTLIFDGSEAPQLIAVLNNGENRVSVSSEQIPDRMKKAIVVIEDDRFYEHSGIDPVGMLRALISNFAEGRLVEGGSTITQQYIKNSYTSDEPTVQRKLREAIYAWELEQKWPKDRILTEYLNTIYFGNGAYGVQTAALTYFNKPVSSLTLAECALLAALPKSPVDYSPYSSPDAARSRRDLVLGKMLHEGMISQAEYDEAAATPLPTHSYPLGPKGSPAPYFVEYVKQQLIARYGEQRTMEGGLRVYTSIDMGKQAAAEKAVASVLDQPDDPSAALVSVDPRNGYVRTMVGGRNFAEQQFNVATQGHRQPGSAFKPFVLATALAQGIPPTAEFVSAPKHIYLGGTSYWDVANFDSVYLGKISLEKATVYSDNAVYADLMMKVGAGAVSDTAHKAGITTQFSAQPAIALGGLDNGVSPLEMASAYATFANGGMKVTGSIDFGGGGPEPISIVKVTDADGRTLDVNVPVTAQAIDPIVSYYVNSVLKQAAMNGTGQWSKLGRPCAGKSGTTEDHVDAWYSGYTPDLVTTVWIGYPAQRTPMTDVRGVRVTGGSWPSEIWHDYMQDALDGTPAHDFVKPPDSDLVRVAVCTDSGMVAGQWCPHKEVRTFLPGRAPTQQCTMHTPRYVEVPAVTDMPLADALRRLEAAGLQADVGYAGIHGRPADMVVDQSPAAGTRIRQDTKVKLTVAGSQPGAAAGTQTGAAQARTQPGD